MKRYATHTLQVPCTYELTLSGPRYDALALWESRNWDRCLPFPLAVIGTPEEKPHEKEMEAQERAEAKKERKAALDNAKREGKDPRLARTPGWPRCYFAGSTCASKTRWCVGRMDGWIVGWGLGLVDAFCGMLVLTPVEHTSVSHNSYSSMMHYKYYLIRRVARRLKGLAKGGARARQGVPLSVDELMRQESWCVSRDGGGGVRALFDNKHTCPPIHNPPRLDAEYERYQELLKLTQDILIDGGSASSSSSVRVTKRLKMLKRLMADDHDDEDRAYGGGGWGGGGMRARSASTGDEEDEDEEDDEEEAYGDGGGGGGAGPGRLAFEGSRRRQSRGYDPYHDPRM